MPSGFGGLQSADGRRKLQAVFGPSSVPVWTAIAALAGAGQVALLAVTAVFVYRYLKETEKLRIAAQQQVEAGFRPAVIAVHDGSLQEGPSLVNIGTGPAIDVEWRVAGSRLQGMHRYLEPGCGPKELGIDGMRGLYSVGAASKTEDVRIECTYRSLSGWQYSSCSSYNLVHSKFTTTFGDGPF